MGCKPPHWPEPAICQSIQTAAIMAAVFYDV